MISKVNYSSLFKGVLFKELPKYKKEDYRHQRGIRSPLLKAQLVVIDIRYFIHLKYLKYVNKYLHIFGAFWEEGPEPPISGYFVSLKLLGAAIKDQIWIRYCDLAD